MALLGTFLPSFPDAATFAAGRTVQAGVALAEKRLFLWLPVLKASALLKRLALKKPFVHAALSMDFSEAVSHF
jgi:hypothetical protein